MVRAVCRFELHIFIVDTQKIYCHVFRGVTIDGVWVGKWIYSPLVYTTRNYTFQTTDTHRLVSSVYYILHYPFPDNGFYRGRFFSFLRSGPLVTAVRSELLSAGNSGNWVPGWRSFHTNLLVFSSQADWQLTTEYSLTNQLLHVTSLNWTAENWLQFG
jgi:hypothetical protein